MRAALRRFLPRPLRRSAAWLAGWVFWARRGWRALLHRDRGARSATTGAATARATMPEQPGVVLPADAPDCLIARNEHGLYCVPRSSRHRPVAQALLGSRVWEAETLDLVRGCEREGDIVHAGTFFGDFIPALARSRAQGAIVWAFEPGDENYRCTQITVMLNELDNVMLVHAGLDAKGGSAMLATSDREGLALGGASRIIKDRARARWWASEKVELVTVDGCVGAERRVAAIQLDVEGHERDALAGAMDTIERCRPLIVLETLPEQRWIEQNLMPLGYQNAGTVNRNFVLRAA